MVAAILRIGLGCGLVCIGGFLACSAGPVERFGSVQLRIDGSRSGVPSSL
jgi:hypothetical protein